ncbi:hypothetical protein [Candidatus Hodgkinia cicadicola]|uniref:hypothetical protein n=1 Tax=Candidatus Hodgkinia cicadicola TaxID=573658 RepID=UPI001788B543
MSVGGVDVGGWMNGACFGRNKWGCWGSMDVEVGMWNNGIGDVWRLLGSKKRWLEVGGMGTGRSWGGLLREMIQGWNGHWRSGCWIWGRRLVAWSFWWD